jgi:pyruvate formate lyase activating enzyme
MTRHVPPAANPATPCATARRALPLVADELDDEPTRAPPAADTTRPLAERLAALTAPGALVERVEGSPTALRCVACAHRCVMEPGRAGACGVRFHAPGDGLRVPSGYVARRYVRAVETNTVFHVRPGARALTFGMYGCDLRCPYCHNWRVSQALRDDDVRGEAPTPITPSALVDEAVAAGCEVVCAAYNEPMIAAEWAREVFAEARARGLVTAAISDGNTTPEALEFMRPVLDVYRVDLKGWSAEQYRALGGRPGPVFDAIARARSLGYWVEVVTLVVPGFNDSLDGLRGVAQRLAAIDASIPWHLNAFHPRYKLTERPRTDGVLLATAAGMAYARGLRFVYVSNLADEVRELSHTRCAACHEVLVERVDYQTRAVRLAPGGACPACGERVPGIWSRPG